MWPFDKIKKAIVEVIESPSSEELEGAALKVSNRYLPHLNENHASWRDIPQEEFEDAQVKIDSFKKWVDKLDDRRIRAAYYTWIDCAQWQLEAAIKETRTHSLRNADEKRRQQYKAERINIAEIASRLPTPKNN